MKRCAFILILFLLPEVAHVSGNEQAGLVSEMYHLHISGGISTWDYDSVREKQKNLSEAFARLRPGFDVVVDENIRRLGLPIVKYNVDDLPDYIDGVIIENNDVDKGHFLSYFNNRKSKIALAHLSENIPDTSFAITLSVLVTERIKKEDFQKLLIALIGVMQESKDLRERLY